MAICSPSVLLVGSILVLLIIIMSGRSDTDDYLQQRRKILHAEKSMSLGGSLKLSVKERQVDEYLLSKKTEELESAYRNASSFLPSQHFFRAKDLIDKSDVFALIKKMPKGGSLHTHLGAAASVDFLVNDFSYREGLYGGYVNGIFKLRFLSSPDQDDRCDWKRVEEYRSENTANFDVWLKRKLSLKMEENPKETYPTVDAMWKHVKAVFSASYEMLCFKPAFQDYVYRVLQELYDDNVIYTELKGTFMPLYELDGTIYSKREFFEIFIKVVENFQRDHPKFQGVRYIHSVYRGVTHKVLQENLNDLIELKKIFPNFIAGLDFVGYEEEGNSLKYYHRQLQEAGKFLKFFFHAGETNWCGHTDENLIDAILLNASRIGHGFSLVKHPLLMKRAKENGIALEICPISNQVLMINDDPRNHPAAQLIATGYPVVIGNDDPSIWGATGLSYDLYTVYMAMTHKNDGIAVLKQLAINSIEFSAASPAEKSGMMEVWEQQWEKFIDNVVQQITSSL